MFQGLNLHPEVLLNRNKKILMNDRKSLIPEKAKRYRRKSHLNLKCYESCIFLNTDYAKFISLKERYKEINDKAKTRKKNKKEEG